MASKPDLTDASANEAILACGESPEERAVSEANRRALAAAVLAYGRGDADAFWSLLDNDVVFHEAGCLPYGGAHAGKEATKRAFAHLHSVFTRLDARFQAVLASRDLVILYQSVTFHTPARGEAATLPVAEVFRFRDGKVIEWRAHYFDSNLVASTLEPA